MPEPRTAEEAGKRLLAGTPFADDQQEIVDVHESIAIDVGGAVRIWNTVAPGIDDDEHIVDIHETVAIGIGTFTLIWNTVAVLVLGVAEGNINEVGKAVLVAIRIAFIWNAIQVQIVAGAIGDITEVGDSIWLAI